LNLPRDGHVPVHLRVEILRGPRPASPTPSVRAHAPASTPAPVVGSVVALRLRLPLDARLFHSRPLLERPLLLLLARLLRLLALLLRALTVLLPFALVLDSALLARAHLLLAVLPLPVSNLRLEILVEGVALAFLGVLPADAESLAQGLHLLSLAPGDGVRVVGTVSSGERSAVRSHGF